MTMSSKTMIVSVLFLAAAIGMWCMGGFVIADYYRVDNLRSAYYMLLPAAVIVFLGIIFFLGAVFGCCAACGDAGCCLMMYFVSIFLIFVFLITSITLSFVYKSEMDQGVETDAKDAIDKFTNKTGDATTDQINYMQEHFKCCGSYNYTTWADTPFGRDNGTGYVPVSCCIDQSPSACFGGDLSAMNSTANLYEVGCMNAIESLLDRNLYYLGAGGIAFLVLLLFVLVASHSCVSRCVCFTRVRFQ